MFKLEPFDPRDSGWHDPGPDPDQRWQESWGLWWYDPDARAAGLHHAGLQRGRHKADEWNWVALDGTVVGKEHALDLAIPQNDAAAFTLGGLEVSSEVPPSRYSVRGAWKDTDCDLTYQAFTEPFAYSYEGASMGRGHYDSLGRVTGGVNVAGKTVTVEGWALQDHSWGIRDYRQIHTYRWLWAIFGEDLAFYVVVLTTDAGMGAMGYVYDNGRFDPVRRATCRTIMADAGHTPLGADVRVGADSGRKWRLEAAVDVASPSTHDDHWLFSDGFATFECGGRLGSGLLEVRELTADVPVLHGSLNG